MCQPVRIKRAEGLGALALWPLQHCLAPGQSGASSPAGRQAGQAGQQAALVAVQAACDLAVEPAKRASKAAHTSQEVEAAPVHHAVSDPL